MTRAIVSLLLAAGLLVGVGNSPANAGKVPPKMLGPGDARVSDIKDKALIRWSKFGFVYIAGQQHSRLTITHDPDSHTLLYRDRGTKRYIKGPKSCHRQKVKKGISVRCTIPQKFRGKRTMFVQVWPRLGNDYVDARTLPRKFRLWALMDAGRDVVYGGAGNDFVNGAFDGDRVYGGPGNDWLRSGPGNDYVHGGPGRDRLVCSENYDTAVRDKHDRQLYRCERVRRG